MSVSEMLSRFRDLHERAMRGGMSAADREAYLASREQLARAFLLAQGLLQDKGKSARQSFRVAVIRQLELTGAVRTVKAVTRDLCVGGFSAIIDHAPEMHEQLSVSLDLGLPERFIAKAKVVSTREHAINARVSFSFVALSEAQTEQLETFLFDCVLARING